MQDEGPELDDVRSVEEFFPDRRIDISRSFDRGERIDNHALGTGDRRGFDLAGTWVVTSDAAYQRAGRNELVRDDR